MNNATLLRLETFDEESGDLNAVIETPQGSRGKYAYDPERGLFRLCRMLPLGNEFPFDFGFVPSTLGDDGDPLDVVVIGDAPLLQGALVVARLIGVIEGKQKESGKRAIRNDRLIAVLANSQDHRSVRSLEDLDDNLVEQLELFFTHYNALEEKTFKPIGRHGPRKAKKLVEQGVRDAQGRNGSRAARER